MNNIFQPKYKTVTVFVLAIFISVPMVLLGQYNTNLGYKAGEAVSSGQKNVMVGARAGEANNGTGNIFIGSQAGQNETGSNILIISNDTTNNTIYGDLNGRRIAIGTDSFPSDSSYRLAVEGKVIAREFKATQTPAWPDYVFLDSYPLRSIESVHRFVQKNNHLPEVPSAKEVSENGIELSEMTAILLKKVEELTLYVIQQQSQIDALSKELSIQRKTESKSNTDIKRD